MIPKIIHYIWFGGEKPKEVLDCIETWKKACPDYEIREWNESNCGICDCDYFKEANAVHKPGFSSDPLRYKVLATYGGIYLDTDVRLLKSFDQFLHHRSFIGKELPLRVGTAIIGSEPDNGWVKEFLSYYECKGRHFIKNDGRLDLTVSTENLSHFLNCTWHRFEHDIAIYPEDFFCCKSFFTGEIKTTEHSVAIHDFACTWKPTKKDSLRTRIKNIWIKFKLRYIRK